MLYDIVGEQVLCWDLSILGRNIPAIPHGRGWLGIAFLPCIEGEPGTEEWEMDLYSYAMECGWID